MPRSVRALQVLTGLLIASFVASTIFRAHGTSIPFFDIWVENIAYACCALLCVSRAIARRPGRWGWAALGVGLVCFTTGSVLFTAVVQYWNPIPAPYHAGLVLTTAGPQGAWTSATRLGLASLADGTLSQRVGGTAGMELPATPSAG